MKKRLIYFLIFTAIMLISAGCSSGDQSLKQMDAMTGNRYMRINLSGYPAIDIKLFDSDQTDFIDDFITTIASTELTLNTVIKDFCIGFDYSNNTLTSKEIVANDDYYPIRGAVCIPKDLSSNNFIIISSDSSFIHNLEVLLSYKGLTLSEYLQKTYGCSISEEELEIYRTYGGAPWLKDRYTVIGQVYSGVEALDDICRLDVDEQYCPLDKVEIQNIDVIE